MSDNLKQRLITAAWMVAIVLPFMYLGGHWTDWIVVVMTGTSCWEVLRIFRGTWPKRTLVIAMLLSAVILLTSIYWRRYMLLPLAAMLLFLAVEIPLHESVRVEETGVVMMMSLIVFLADMGYDDLREMHRYAFFALVLSTCLTDAGAYFAGNAFGKHKMIERISPKKTWEGAIGGWIAGFAAGVLSFRLLCRMPLGLTMALSVGIPVIGQFGDLFFSAIKRHYGIKDFGTWLKGHGGSLDRIDSILFTLVYAFIVLSAWEYFG